MWKGRYASSAEWSPFFLFVVMPELFFLLLCRAGYHNATTPSTETTRVDFMMRPVATRLTCTLDRCRKERYPSLNAFLCFHVQSSPSIYRILLLL